MQRHRAKRHAPGSDPGTEARLGGERIYQLRDSLGDLREAMEQEVSPE
jgi:hypothetical protein